MQPSERFFSIKGPNGNLAAVHHGCGSDRLVILAHGFTGTKIETGRLFVSTARALVSAGIDALRFDFYGSGDSEGEFHEMTPNTEIADLRHVIKWGARRSKRLGVLGLSLGGAISICTVAQSPEVKALVTWSTLPRFRDWRLSPEARIDIRTPNMPGRKFYTDRPAVDVPEAYQSIRIPKLQVQGDQDLPGFVEKFSEYFKLATGPKKHVIIPGGDHVFMGGHHRTKAIAESVKWFARYL